MKESIGPGSTPNRPPSQPCWKTATITPSEAPIESRFINAACTGITSERKTISSSSAESSTTMPMNTGSFPARTWLKSICPAVTPPMRTVVPVALSTGGRVESRRRFTSWVVAAAWGAVVG